MRLNEISTKKGQKNAIKISIKIITFFAEKNSAI